MWNAEVSEWEKALQAYPAVIQAYESSVESKKGLVDLERFMWEELGESVRARDTPFLQADEYRRVIKWKLKRGKWRPRLQKFADELAEGSIKEQSRKAFETLKKNQIRDSISLLSKLRGCGPATASAVLAACDTSIPFMSDELLVVVPCFKGQRDYTVSVYMTLVDEVRKKVKELCGQGGDWNVRNLERAVFASAVAEKLGMNLEPSTKIEKPKIERPKAMSGTSPKNAEDVVDNGTKKQDLKPETPKPQSKPAATVTRAGTKRKDAKENAGSKSSEQPRRKSARLQRK